MRRGICASVAVLALALTGNAQAATITVTATPDDFTAAPGGTCSLRQAVQAANTNADYGGCTREGTGAADTIRLEGGETYTRSLAGVDDTNAAGDLDITGRTTIKVLGPSKATIDGNDEDRVFQVLDGRLTASRVIIQNGKVAASEPANEGGGIAVAAGAKLILSASRLRSNDVVGNGTCQCGGGLSTRGTAELSKVQVTGNDAGAGGGIGGYGGGIAFIATNGKLTVRTSTIAHNDALTGAAGVLLDGKTSASISRSTINDNHATGETYGGGGISQDVTGLTTTITNVTISGNTSNTAGGGIFVYQGKPRLNAVTITDNTADLNGDGGMTTGAMGGGIYDGGEATLRNSIIAGNFATRQDAADCYPDTVTHGVIGVGTGCAEGTGTVATNHPRLRPLADNGGPTKTHALRRGSPAIGRAGTNAPGMDQRGVHRDNNPDAGAYERR